MVSCQKGPTRHAYAWRRGPFWQDILEVWDIDQTVNSQRTLHTSPSFWRKNIDGLVQDYSDSSALGMEWLQSCLKPLISCHKEVWLCVEYQICWCLVLMPLSSHFLLMVPYTREIKLGWVASIWFSLNLLIAISFMTIATVLLGWSWVGFFL